MSQGKGTFEVEESSKDQLLVSGRVLTLDPEDCPSTLPDEPFPTDVIALSGKDILADLAAKGLTYTPKYSALKAVLVGDRGERDSGSTVKGAKPRAISLSSAIALQSGSSGWTAAARGSPSWRGSCRCCSTARRRRLWAWCC